MLPLQSISIFLLKSLLTCAIMLLWYLIALRSRRMNNANRIYLLLTALAGAVVPLLHFEWHIATPATTAPVIRMMEISGIATVDETIAEHLHTSLALQDVIMLLYAFITISLIILPLLRIRRVLRIQSQHSVTPMNGYSIVHTRMKEAPFSFMNKVFWNDGISMDSEDGQRILQHELVHVHQRHTADKLFMQLLTAICWLNPLMWYIKQELNQIHEFLADEGSVTDPDTFARMLLTAHTKGKHTPVTSHFFSSPIKRRLTMITQNKNTRYGMLRKALMLPVLLIPVALFSFRISNHITPAPVAGHTVTLVLDPAHGGTDKGAVSPDGYTEKELSLRICKKIAALAPEYGVTVKMTRTGDTYPTLNERVLMANKEKDALFISVHINKAQEGRPIQQGYEYIVSSKSPRIEESRKLASAVAATMGSSGRHTELREQGIHVLKQNNHPCIAIEWATVENAADIARIQNDEQLAASCRQLLQGITTYASTMNNRR